MIRLIGLIAGFAAAAAIAGPGATAARADGGKSATPARQIAQSRPRPRRGDRVRPRRLQRRPHGGLRVRPRCIAGFRVYTTPDQNTPANQYVCTAYIAFTCAPPYLYDHHGLLHMGGDGDYWPYYRCKRAQPATHVGAVLCASGFHKIGAPPNPATQTGYQCRGAEPECAPGYQYFSFKKKTNGWWYVCRKY